MDLLGPLPVRPFALTDNGTNPRMPYTQAIQGVMGSVNDHAARLVDVAWDEGSRQYWSRPCGSRSMEFAKRMRT